MKRSMKNVLMITIIALLSIGMVFTYSYAKSNVATNNVASMNGGTPPQVCQEVLVTIIVVVLIAFQKTKW